MHTCHHLSPQLPMLCCPHFWMRKWGCSEAPRHTVTAHHWQRQGASWPPWVEAAHSTLCPFPVDGGPCQPKSKDQMIPMIRPLNCGEKIRPHLNSRGDPLWYPLSPPCILLLPPFLSHFPGHFTGDVCVLFPKGLRKHLQTLAVKKLQVLGRGSVHVHR